MMKLWSAGALAVLVIGGCSAEPAAGPAPPSSTATRPADWRQVDPCTLLTDAEITEYLHTDQVDREREDVADTALGCAWQARAKSASSVHIALVPASDTALYRDTAQRTAGIGGRTAYVHYERDDGVTVAIDTGPVWVYFSGGLAAEDLPRPVPRTHQFDRSAPLIEKIITRLGW